MPKHPNNTDMLTVRRVLVASLLILSAVAAYGQFGRQFGGRFGRSDNYTINVPPDSEFVFARWRYSGGRRGWAHDYPAAEQHLNQVMDEVTGIEVERMSYRFVDISSPDIFDYPFGYISEPGQMWLTDEEVENFSEFLARGGIVMVDDFDGRRDFDTLYQNLKRVLPDDEPYVLTDNHPLLHTFYDIDGLYIESPYNVGAPAVFYGIDDEFGNLSVILCHNNDVGDFWEHIDEPRFRLEPSTEALRLGINIVLYSMTH